MSNLIKLLDDASEMACGPARQHIPDTLYHMAAREIERLTQQLEEAKRDSDQLNALINNSHWTIMGSDEKGYLVWDQSDGLTAAGGGKTAREAIDKAMEKSK